MTTFAKGDRVIRRGDDRDDRDDRTVYDVLAVDGAWFWIREDGGISGLLRRHVHFEKVPMFFRVGTIYRYSTTPGVTYKCQEVYEHGDTKMAVMFWTKPNGERGIACAYGENFKHYTVA